MINDCILCPSAGIKTTLMENVLCFGFCFLIFQCCRVSKCWFLYAQIVIFFELEKILCLDWRVSIAIGFLLLGYYGAGDGEDRRDYYV